MLENMTEHYPIIMIRIKECMGRYPTSGSSLVSRGWGWGGRGWLITAGGGVIYLRIFGSYIWHECFFQSEPSMMVVDSRAVFVCFYMSTCQAPHFRMSPQHFIMATVQHCSLLLSRVVAC